MHYITVNNNYDTYVKKDKYFSKKQIKFSI
jgi:hypothetical protein